MLFSLTTCGTNGARQRPGTSPPAGSNQPPPDVTPPPEVSEKTDAPTALNSSDADLVEGLALSGGSVDSAGDQISTWLDNLGL